MSVIILLCFIQAVDVDKSVGAIVCKLDAHRKVRRGYIAMLAVDENYRKQHIGILSRYLL